MKILVISYAFPPWLAPRSVQAQRILNALASMGCDITVVQRSLDGFGVATDNELASLTSTAIKTMRVAPPRFGRYAEIALQGRLSRLPDDANLWALKVFFLLQNRVKDYDFVITFSTPVSDHIVGLLVKATKHVPWIAFFSDPFTSNPYLRLSPSERSINTRLERSILRHADGVIFVNEYSLRSMVNGPTEEWASKCHVIPHAFDMSLYNEGIRPGNSLVMRHLGDFYGKRTPEALLKGAAIAIGRIPSLKEKLRIEMYGAPDGMEEWLRRAGLGDAVQYKGRVNYLRNVELMKTADVLLVIDAPARENLFLTSKLIDYVGARRPILAVTPLRGPTADLMKEINGDVCDTSDVEGIAGCIVRYAREKEAGDLKIDVPDHVYRRYEVKSVAKRYLELMDAVTIR